MAYGGWVGVWHMVGGWLGYGWQGEFGLVGPCVGGWVGGYVERNE